MAYVTATTVSRHSSETATARLGERDGPFCLRRTVGSNGRKSSQLRKEPFDGTNPTDASSYRRRSRRLHAPGISKRCRQGRSPAPRRGDAFRRLVESVVYEFSVRRPACVRRPASRHPAAARTGFGPAGYRANWWLPSAKAAYAIQVARFVRFGRETDGNAVIRRIRVIRRRRSLAEGQRQSR